MNEIPQAWFAAHRQLPVIDPWKGRYPKLHPTVMVSPGAAAIGDVVIGMDSSVWYQCALRGDVFPIEIGQRSNIQDLTLMHTRYQQLKCIVGDDCTIGHSVVLHACTVKSRCLIGMGAIILDGAEIGEDSIVGAHSLVTQNKKFPPRSMILGSPAKRVRELTDEEVASILKSAHHYVELKNQYPSVETLFRQ